jgi:hypothetical protein
MAILARPKDNEDYARLVGMTQPSATPSKRIGTEAPVGSVAAGPAAGKSASEFTQSTKSSPGNVFARQLSGANIEGITSLAEKPLGREAAAEALRVAGEGTTYKTDQETNLSKQPQFNDFSAAAGGVASGDETTTATGQAILNRSSIPVTKLDIGDIKEFTPNQALRGGSVESLLRGEATGPYTSGMAGLDALLFQKKGGAAQLGQRGIALRAAGQATADALEKSATADAEKNAADLVSGQKSGFISALSGAADPMLAKFQSGLSGLKAGRQAVIGQAGSAIEQDLALMKQQARTQILNELKASGKQLTPEEETFILNTLMRSPTNQKLSNAYTLPEYVDPTLADVATDEETQSLNRLVQMLGLGGANTSKYNLGNRTNLGKASGPVNFDEYADAQILGDYRNEAVNALNQYRSDASGSVPKISVPQNPSGNTNTLNPYDAARARAERGGY